MSCQHSIMEDMHGITIPAGIAYLQGLYLCFWITLATASGIQHACKIIPLLTNPLCVLHGLFQFWPHPCHLWKQRPCSHQMQSLSCEQYLKNASFYPLKNGKHWVWRKMRVIFAKVKSWDWPSKQSRLLKGPALASMTTIFSFLMTSCHIENCISAICWSSRCL